MKRILALIVVTYGCADMDEKPVGWQIHDSEVAVTNPYTTPETIPVDVPVAYQPTLSLPTGDCQFPSLALAELPVGVSGDQPSIVEGFDAAGCPTELWVNNYAGGDLSLTAYMPWNPPPAYMIYRPWVDTYKMVGDTKTTERRDSYDGPLFSREETQFDAAGEVLTRKIWGNDWAMESSFGSEYRESRFHPRSRLQILEEQKSQDVTQYRSRTEVNAAGEPLRTFVFQSGVERKIQEWTYVDGRLAAMTYHEGASRAEATYVWHADSSHTVITLNQTQGWKDVHDYDSEGRLTRHTQDENRDGQIEYLQTKTYDALGNTISETTGYEFVNGMATRGSEVEREYDGDRLTWEIIEAKGFNMQMNPPNTLSVTRTDYTYSDTTDAHESERLVRYPDGRVMREVSRFDALGHEILRTQDTGDDGSVEWRVERLYDGERQLSEINTNESNSNLQEWIYDDQDRLVLWVQDYNADGVADSGTRYRYDVDGLAAYNALTPPLP